MFWSNFVNVIRINEETVFFNSLFPRFIHSNTDFNICRGEELNTADVQRLGQNLIDSLIEKKVIVENKDCIEDYLAEREKFSLENIIFLVTNKCNLCCDYCQIENNILNHKSTDLGNDNIDKVFKYIESSTSKGQSITINITGGEPLANWDGVQYICDKASELSEERSIRIVLFTNGVLMTKDKAEYLFQKNVFVIVSLDGPKDFHDVHRKNDLGEGSYEKALNGYWFVKKAGCLCAISSVATEKLYNNIEDYWKWVDELNPDSVGINYPHLLLEGDSEEVDFPKYTEMILKLHKYAMRDGIYLENYERFSKKIKQGKLRYNECQACGRGITVSPDGFVGPCKSLLVSKRVYSPIEEIDGFREKYCDWTGRSPVFDPECINCEALSICGGGCAYDSYILFGGNYLSLDKRMCNHVRKMMQEIVVTEKQSAEENKQLFASVGH